MGYSYPNIIGKTILVGITYKDKDDKIIELKQFHGKISSASKDTGIQILLDGTEEIFCLPPNMKAIEKAQQGEYRLHSTGEVVVDPDLISCWTIYVSEQSGSEDPGTN